MLHAERLPIETKNALYPTQLNSAGDATLAKDIECHRLSTWEGCDTRSQGGPVKPAATGFAGKYQSMFAHALFLL